MTAALQLKNALEPLFFNRTGALVMCVAAIITSAILLTLLALSAYLTVTPLVAAMLNKLRAKEIAVVPSSHIHVAGAIIGCIAVGLSVAIGIGVVYPAQRSLASDQAQELASVLQSNHFSVRVFDAYDDDDIYKNRKYREVAISENLSADSTEKIFGQPVALPTPHREITLSWAQAVQADSAVRAVSHGRVALVAR